MDIKSKKLSRLDLQKVLVFLIVLVFFTGLIMSTLQLITKQNLQLSMLGENDYFRSKDYINHVSNINYNLQSLVLEYRSQDYILKEKPIDDNNSEYYNKKIDFYDDYLDSLDETGQDISFKEIMALVEKERAQELEKVKEDIRKKDLQRFKSIQEIVDEYDKGIGYYATNGRDVFTNLDKKTVSQEDFKTYKSYVIIDQNKLVTEPDYSKEGFYRYANLNPVDHEKDDFKIYIGFTEDYLNPLMRQWEKDRSVASKDLKDTIIFLVGLTITLVYMFIITGRADDGSNQIKMRFIDRLYTDLNLILSGATIIGWVFVISYLDNNLLLDFNHKGNIFVMLTVITYILGAIGLSLILSLVRHMKNSSIFTHSLVYTIISKFVGFIKSIHHSSTIGKKVVMLLIIYPIIVIATFFIFPLTIGFAIWLGLKKAREFEEIKEGVVEIKNGNLEHRIDLETEGEFRGLAENINSIGEGLKNAVDNELTSERHRSELITNVSHDIRTPLTSIITYVDLLKYEDKQEKQEEYIDVLDKKSQRLKQLIDDLFEASKYSSGNIPVHLNELNIVSLLTQGLGELNDRVEEQDLNFIMNFEEEEILVKADGDLLWRAIENLLSNIFKYGLRGSRVYVDIFRDEKYVNLIIKNISAYELNISEDELMERFKRGDESRNSEGSGLGLSIAASLIELQEGKFHIEIDGDLFKTIIRLPKQ